MNSSLMRAVAVLALSTMLAGCLGPAQRNGAERERDMGPPEGAGSPGSAPVANATNNVSLPSGSPLPATFQLECSELHSGYVPLTEDEFTSFAPPGFSPTRYGGFAGSVEPAPFAGIIVHSNRCTFEGTEALHVVVFVPVDPPAEFERKEWNALFLGGLFTNPEMHAALAEWGLGSVALRGDVALSQAAPGTGASQGSGNFTVALSVGLVAPIGFFPEQWRLFGVKGGAVVGALDMARTGDPLGVGAATVDIGGNGAPIVLMSRTGEGHLFGNVGYTFTQVPMEASA